MLTELNGILLCMFLMMLLVWIHTECWPIPLHRLGFIQKAVLYFLLYLSVKFGVYFQSKVWRVIQERERRTLICMDHMCISWWIPGNKHVRETNYFCSASCMSGFILISLIRTHAGIIEHVDQHFNSNTATDMLLYVPLCLSIFCIWTQH